MGNKPESTDWFELVNPNAGNGNGKKDWARISDLFRKNDINVEPAFTERKGHAIILTRELISRGYRSNNLIVRSETPLWNEADGESLGHTPAEFGTIPSVIKIVYGTRLI
jgi:diacylglycerol kinase family enzyme